MPFTISGELKRKVNAYNPTAKGVPQMPVLCDFIQIVGDSYQSIPRTEGDADVHLGKDSPFNTGGRRADSTALLVYSAWNMAGSAVVCINGEEVGKITATSDEVWSTQLIALWSSVLHDGNNEIVLKQVTNAFRIKDVICFFHQSA